MSQTENLTPKLGSIKTFEVKVWTELDTFNLKPLLSLNVNVDIAHQSKDICFMYTTKLSLILIFSK